MAFNNKRPAIGISLKLNSKVAAFFDDEDAPEEQSKRRRTFSEIKPPSDPAVRQNADKLAEFVATNGRGVEEVTKQRNPGNTPFRFLFDTSSDDYRYYESKIREFQTAAGAQANPPQPSAAPPQPSAFRAPGPPGAPYAVRPSIGSLPGPSGAPYAVRPSTGSLPGPPGAPYGIRPSSGSLSGPPRGPLQRSGKLHAVGQVGLLKEEAPETHMAKAAQQQGDSLAAMEAFAALMEKKAADKKQAEEEEAMKNAPLLNETAFDRRRVTAVLKDDGSRGHHMQDFIPKEELAKILSKTNDEKAKAHAAVLEAQSRIGADNVGHKLLQKMGWKEGQGLGADGKGVAAPIAATGSARDTAGLGAHDDKEVKETDDIYEAYRKRMQLGYQHRPNPLGNPRRKYY